MVTKNLVRTTLINVQRDEDDDQLLSSPEYRYRSRLVQRSSFVLLMLPLLAPF